MNTKIDANTQSLGEFKSSHNLQQKDIVILFSEVSTIKSSLLNEFSISGHLGALNANVDLLALVVELVNF